MIRKIEIAVLLLVSLMTAFAQTPQVATVFAINIGPTSATLQSVVDVPAGSNCYYVLIDVQTGAQEVTPSVTVTTNFQSTLLKNLVSIFQPGQQYEYQISCVTPNGTSALGEVQKFSTPQVALPALYATDPVKSAGQPGLPGASPGEIVSIYGVNLGGDNVNVLFDGQPAYVTFVSPTQINAQVPFGLTLGQATVQVNVGYYNGPTYSTYAQTVMKPSNPGIFSVTQGNSPNSVVFPSSTPAPSNGVVVVWGTGFGATTGNPQIGILPITGIPIVSTFGPTVTFVLPNGATLPGYVQWSGLAQGEAGVWQANVKLPLFPAGTTSALMQLTGDGGATASVTIAVNAAVQ